MQIEEEILSKSLYEEILPLGRKCWAESTQIKGQNCSYYGDRDFEIEPDFETYEKISNADAMVLICVRDAGSLVGYAVAVLYKSWHHKSITCANVDSAYLEKEHRSYGPVLVDFLEKKLKSIGIQQIAWPTHIDGPLYKMLSAQGYVADDTIMEKRICV